MLFNSYLFLVVFLPIAWLGYRAAAVYGRSPAIVWLAGVSLVFYATWAAYFLWLLTASVLFNYLAGQLILNLSAQHRSNATRIVLAGSIAVDLTVLAYYKYSGFMISNMVSAFGWAAIPWNVVLPIGISFFTFTQIAFLVDAYIGLVRRNRFVEYVLFVTYFPHLVAGPIIHHAEMIPQFLNRATVAFDPRRLSLGLATFIIGLGKKVLLADNLAPYADAAFTATYPLPASEAWIGALAYSLQLYFDFSGYSDMAVGLSLMFNIYLPINFYSPYKAKSIIEFWRRWHMTLSRFLRDYLYIPLGGGRRGPMRRYNNILITMVLGGLWHGAAWTFILWGLLHGIYLLINHAFREIRSRFSLQMTRGQEVAGWVLTFIAVIAAWVFFRSADLTGALKMLAAMVGANGIAQPLFAENLGFIGRLLSFAHLARAGGNTSILVTDAAFATSLVVIALAIVIAMPNTQQIMRLPMIPPVRNAPRSSLPSLEPPVRYTWAQWQPGWPQAIVLGCLLTLSLMSLGKSTSFLYFQF